MASVANPTSCSFEASRSSSLCSRPIEASPSNLALKTRPLLLSAASSRSPEKRGIPVTGGFSGTALWTHHRLSWRRSVESPAMGPAGGDSEVEVPKKKMVKKPKMFWRIVDTVHTLAYMSTWYIMGVIYILWFCVVRYLLHGACTILTKEVYNYFPYPYFVSSVHLLVGIAYWLATQCLPQQLGPPREPMDMDLFFRFVPVAACHAIGHVMYNVSLAVVASSFALTIHALEPFINTIASGFVLGQRIPLSLWLPLAPIVIGVSMASLAELSFNWTGFMGTMISNVSLTCRSIYYKKAKAKTAMDSANVYGYISLIALLFCIPASVLVEGPELMQHGFKDVIAKVGLRKLLSDLFWTGMLSHLAHRFATKTKVERNEPRLHAVLNALQRALGIGYSIIYFGNRISTQTGIGTVMALTGVAIYNIIRANIIVREKREEAVAAKAAWDVKVALAKKNSNRNLK